eukprot:1159636-Pelagomonas_calceolata.AAC.4
MLLPPIPGRSGHTSWKPAWAVQAGEFQKSLDSSKSTGNNLLHAKTPKALALVASTSGNWLQNE